MNHRSTLVCAALFIAGPVSVPACSVEDRVAVIGDGGPNAAIPGSRFATVRAGQSLPDEAECAVRVQRSTWEPRAENLAANHRVATTSEIAMFTPWGHDAGFDDRAMTLSARVNGNFTGTTDEILQWAACKWGFSDDLVRAIAVDVTEWRQAFTGCWTTTLTDCPPGAVTRNGGSGLECAECYGILQIKWRFHMSGWPMIRDSTPFSVDYFTGLLRSCFEGWTAFFGQNAPLDQPYVSDDEWSCAGAVIAGEWRSSEALDRTAAIKGYAQTRPWTQPGF